MKFKTLICIFLLEALVQPTDKTKQNLTFKSSIMRRIRYSSFPGQAFFFMMTAEDELIDNPSCWV